MNSDVEQDLLEAASILDDWLHACSNRLDRIAMNRARQFLDRPNIRKLLARREAA